MADLTDTISLQVQSSTKNVDNGILKLISDLKNLRNGMDISEDSVNSLSNQFKELSVNLSSSTLKDSLSKINSDTLKYVTTSGQMVTVNRKNKNGNDEFAVSVKNVNKELQSGINYWKKFSSAVGKGVFSGQLLWNTLSSISNKLIDITKGAAEYEEALNLFAVSMGKQAEQATAWMERFSEALYLDPANVMQYMGSLNSLVSGLGVGAENSYKMSKNLTQLTYDLASFKNLKFEESFRKIQSAISGEIEPLILAAIICECYRKRSEPIYVGCDNYCYC